MRPAGAAARDDRGRRPRPDRRAGRRRRPPRRRRRLAGQRRRAGGAATRPSTRCGTDRLVPFEENLRLRRPVRAGPARRRRARTRAGPADGARLGRPGGAAAGGRAGRGVAHVGPTAVPGLPAEDVLDLQLGVDPGADADAVRDALADAGFPAPARGRHPAGRVHAAADPGRPARAGTCARSGSPGWRAPLLLRDWLRAGATPVRRPATGAPSRRPRYPGRGRAAGPRRRDGVRRPGDAVARSVTLGVDAMDGRRRRRSRRPVRAARAGRDAATSIGEKGRERTGRSTAADCRRRPRPTTRPGRRTTRLDVDAATGRRATAGSTPDRSTAAAEPVAGRARPAAGRAARRLRRPLRGQLPAPGRPALRDHAGRRPRPTTRPGRLLPGLAASGPTIGRPPTRAWVRSVAVRSTIRSWRRAARPVRHRPPPRRTGDGDRAPHPAMLVRAAAGCRRPSAAPSC